MSGIRYVTVTMENLHKVEDFLFQHFTKGEPMNRCIGLAKEDLNSLELWKGMLEACTKNPVSFAAVNENDEIVACRLSEILDLSKKRRILVKEELPSLPEKPAKIFSLLSRLEAGVEDMLPVQSCKRALEFRIVCTRPDYYRKGIASKLIELSCAKGKELGCDIVVVCATATNSQQMFANKLGYTKLKVILHEDYLDKNGKQILNCDDGTKKAELLVKLL